jgi:hypothetical protein
MQVNEADILAQFKGGRSRGSFTQAVADTWQGLVTAWANTSIDAAKKQLDDNKRTASGGLKQSIAPRTRVFVGGMVVEIEAADYAKFVDKGVDGLEVKHGSPYSFRTPFAGRKMADEIREWIPAKGAMLPEGFRSYESFAYAIATNVKKKGIKPTPFISDTFNDESLRALKTALEKKMGQELNVTFKQLWQL